MLTRLIDVKYWGQFLALRKDLIMKSQCYLGPGLEMEKTRIPEK